MSFELFQIGIEFAQYVFNTGQIFACVAQAVFSFTAAFFVFGNARGFFQKQPQFFGFGFNDSADGSLPDDGVGARPQTGSQKYVLHITSTHRLVVDVIAAVAVAGQYALDRNFFKLVPLTTRAVRLVIKHQLHTGTAGGFACVGAIENNVLHGFTAQFAGSAFSQHPTHSVNDVGLAAAIGADDTHKLSR